MSQRAQSLDDVMTLYFSQPIIDGVLLWGFSDNHGPCRETCSLFEGDEFIVRKINYPYPHSLPPCSTAPTTSLPRFCTQPYPCQLVLEAAAVIVKFLPLLTLTLVLYSARQTFKLKLHGLPTPIGNYSLTGTSIMPKFI